MATALEKLRLLRTVYRRLSGAVFEGASVVGQLEASEENCRLVDRLDALNLIFPTDDFARPEPGELRRLELAVPRDKGAFFAHSLDALLNSQLWARHEAPNVFYLSDSDEICTAEEQPVSEQANYYLQTLKAVSLLKLVADYGDSSTGVLKLVFLQREKLEVPIVYTASALRPLEKLDEWLSLLSDDIHREQRRTIFRTVLLDELRSIDANERFVKFIASFENLFSRFQDNYQLYVAEFSFEKVVAEVTEKKLDYVLKLNKTFSDIQNQLLAIPVAVILAGGQMEQMGRVTVKNSIVYIGVVVFAFLMALLVRNQLDNVSAIGREIRDYQARLKNKRTEVAVRIGNSFEELGGRERRQRLLIRIVDSLVALALLGTTCLFFWYSGFLSAF